MKWKGPGTRTIKLPARHSDQDQRFMKQALRLAEGGLGRVWPNPAVGCVLVRDGRIIGSGRTGDGGRPHAEDEALKMASGAALGATAYITFEPCAHEGETPSCARLLAEAGVERVVYAIPDPDPRTAGKGAEILKKAGLQVDVGLLQEEAMRLNKGFILRQTEGRPLITMKLATSKDGKIAALQGQETAITGKEAREFSHRLRASHDAILVGIGTVLADDPDLTCRLAGLERASPVRIVLDSGLKIPAGSRLVRSAGEVPVWVVSQSRELPPELARYGVVLITVSNIKNIKEIVENIAKKGITRLLVEGGGKINAAVLESGLADALYWFSAAHMTIGPGGVPGFHNLDIFRAAEVPGLAKTGEQRLGQDLVEILERME